ncbi:hypothetical protein INT45_002032 [Circinella minor]|uniref:CENP-T/Histone H4 histone fold domain-containing protein n=1 Tax=Circinella minor TaxID=1195481 RepID=A0A8H7SE85_9FUNG|nr:hypothetical protein INT45_002032 [Circinella minor]
MDLKYTSPEDLEEDDYSGLYTRQPTTTRANAAHVLRLLSNAPSSEPSGESVQDSPITDIVTHEQRRYELFERQRQYAAMLKREREEEFMREYEALGKKRQASSPVTIENYSFRRRRGTHRQLGAGFNDTLSTITYNSDTNFTAFSKDRAQRDFGDLEQDDFHSILNTNPFNENENEHGFHWVPPTGTLPDQITERRQRSIVVGRDNNTQDDPFLPNLSFSQLSSQPIQQHDNQELLRTRLQEKRDIQDMLDIKGKGRMISVMETDQEIREQQQQQLNEKEEVRENEHPASLRQSPLPSQVQQQHMDQDFDDIEYDYGDDGGVFVDEKQSMGSKDHVGTDLLEKNEHGYNSYTKDEDMIDVEFQRQRSSGRHENHFATEGSQERSFDNNDLISELSNLDNNSIQQGITRIPTNRRYTNDRIQELINTNNPVAFRKKYYSTPTIQKQDIKKLFTRFASLPCKVNVGNKLQELSEIFFDQMADDLVAYAKHSNEETITREDMELLLKRQGIVDNKTTTVESLAHKYLSREQWDKVIVSARAYNTLYPK